ncbi:MAG: DUF2231 domain-containing protein [Actinomycetota bacterium]|nr:DUF2231 domain-containing protein [Actinomycetota bacterium]
MEPTSLVDRLVRGRGSALDHASSDAQAALATVADTPAARPVVRLLHGNEVVGHPLHPVVVALPIGAWCVSGWYDARGARSSDSRHDHAADGALRVGLVTALAAVLTGLPQYLDTSDGVRREAAVHAALNNVAFLLFLGSWAARKRGSRPFGRKLSAAALSVVGVSGYLGGDLAFRHGVGMRPQALADAAQVRHS